MTEPISAIAPLPAEPALPTARMAVVIGLTLILGYTIVLVGALLGGHFLLGENGAPLANDFVNVFAAGKLTLSGQAAAAYDWTLHKAAEVDAVGHDFANYYGWHYPPVFLPVAAALALLPYLAALILWLAATGALFALTLKHIVGARAGIIVALGFPATLWNIAAGQNGFLTAALIGGTLGLLERHPVAAGMCLGLLSYKPQFGLLFPVVLFADRRWTALATATAVTITLAVLSWLVFGNAPWLGFLHGLSHTGKVVLADGAADLSRLQSVYGFFREHGADSTLAAGEQMIATVTVAGALVVLWRSNAAYEMKAAALAAAAIVATPYVYIYDLTVLAVAAGFLIRHARIPHIQTVKAGRVEMAGLAVAGALILAFPYLKGQTGLAAALIVFGLALRPALGGAAFGYVASQRNPRHTVPTV
jgi:hypothetical protein